jgi:DNA polymerase-3 subunit beta
MKFVISSTDLLNHLQSLVKVINSKNTLPALDNFLFSLEGSELTITASDLDTTLITIVELETAEGNGTIGIDARRLLSTIKEFNEPLTLNIDTDTYNVDIISEKGKYSLVGIDGSEYPEIPKLAKTGSTAVNLTAEAFVSSINNTLFAVSDDDIRPIMTGIFYGFNEERMVVAASDSHKLVRYKRMDVKSEKEAGFILPRKPAGLLKNLLPKDETPVEILIDKKNAQIRFSTITLICRLIEGTYPNFEGIIPINQPYKLHVDRHSLQSVLKRVSLYSNPAVQLIRLDIAATEMNVSAQDLDFSISAHERINCTYEGEDMAIGFKSVFLLEVLANLGGQETLIELSEPSRAILLSPLNKENEDEDVLMLLMPITIEA